MCAVQQLVLSTAVGWPGSDNSVQKGVTGASPKPSRINFVSFKSCDCSSLAGALPSRPTGTETSGHAGWGLRVLVRDEDPISAAMPGRAGP